MPVLRSGQLIYTGANSRRAQAAAVLPTDHRPANFRANGNGHKRTTTQRLAAAPQLSAQSALVDRLGWLNRLRNSLGDTFGGLRNVDLQLGYSDHLTVSDYRRRYKRGGLAKRIVRAFPLATWSADARLTEDDKATSETAFEEAARELFDSLGVWQKFARADVLAGLGHYSIIVIGDGTNIEQPLPKRVRQLLYLTPYAEDNASIEKWDMNPISPRYGQPETYSINLGAIDITDTPFIGNRPPSKTVKVHWSRVIHVAEGLLENEVYGEPALEAVWNYLDDLVKVVGGGAEAAWKRMDPGLQIDVDPELDIDEGELDKLSDQLDEYQHGLRRTLQTRGTKMSLLSTTVAGFGPNASAIIDLICGTKGIPQRVLLGSERGELASTQDRDNWSDRITERRRMFANPLIRQFVDRLIERRVLPTPKGSPSDSVVPQGKYQYVVAWPRVRSLDGVGTAEILSKLAGANQANSQANGGLIVTATEIRGIAGLGEQPPEAKVPYGKQPTQGATTTADDGNKTSDAPVPRGDQPAVEERPNAQQ